MFFNKTELYISEPFYFYLHAAGEVKSEYCEINKLLVFLRFGFVDSKKNILEVIIQDSAISPVMLPVDIVISLCLLSNKFAII